MSLAVVLADDHTAVRGQALSSQRRFFRQPYRSSLDCQDCLTDRTDIFLNIDNRGPRPWEKNL